jgi:aminoglycoside 3-N-acetyltransferase
MLTFADFKSALAGLGLGGKPAIVHASLKAFGVIQGGAETVLQALLAAVGGLVMPAFTYKTMIIPEVGPPNNGLTYGSYKDLNRMAEPFFADMPVDPLMGVLPETLRHSPGAHRTAHPILSFTGVNASAALHTQTIYNPFAPIGVLADQDGWVLLLGVDHTVDTSIHYAEKLAGRRQFVRWALSKNRVVQCYGFPGCSEGFNDITPDIQEDTRTVEIGESSIDAVPLKRLFQAVEARLNKDPLALLCQREECERCNAVRETVSVG